MAKIQQETIHGLRAIIEAIHRGIEIEKVLLKTGLVGTIYNELIVLIRKEEIAHQYVPAEKIESYKLRSHQGVIALVSPVAYQDADEVLSEVLVTGKTPLFLILDHITDVRNFGAIARSAECAGAHAIIIPFKNSAKVTPDAMKTSAGALNSIPVCKVQNLKTYARNLRKQGVRIVAATEKGENVYTEADLTMPTAIIMGSEDKGIDEALLRLADEQVKIPIQGDISSLNVSVAASLMMFEAVRQRG